jgi:hypothetical protein
LAKHCRHCWLTLPRAASQAHSAVLRRGMILNRARTIENFPRPGEIVGGLTRPAGLQLAQTTLAALQSKRQSTHAALREAIATRTDVVGDDGRNAQQVRDLDAELRDIDRQILTATEDRDRAMRPFAKAVAVALAPLRKAAAREAADAIAGLIEPLRVLDEIAVELGRVGSDEARFGVLYLNAISGLAERLARMAAT